MIAVARRVAVQSIRKTLDAFSLELRRKYATTNNSIPLLNALVKLAILARGKGYVLQIGANDGLMDDPVRAIIMKYALPALLVEPLPDVFTKLRANYRNQPDVYFENCAIGGTSGDGVIYRINPSAVGLPAWAQGLASFNRDNLLKHKWWDGVDTKLFLNSIEQCTVPVITFRLLLEKHPKVRDVIALQVDTEGYDFEVIKSAVDAGCKPSIISYEHKHLTVRDQVECQKLLASLGYGLTLSEGDTIALQLDILN